MEVHEAMTFKYFLTHTQNMRKPSPVYKGVTIVYSSYLKSVERYNFAITDITPGPSWVADVAGVAGVAETPAHAMAAMAQNK